MDKRTLLCNRTRCHQTNRNRREVEIAKTGKRDYIVPILAGVVTIGFFGLLALMFYSVVPIENRQIIDIMIGSLGTAWITIVGYYFGSSMGSQKKDETIQGLSK